MTEMMCLSTALATLVKNACLILAELILV